jgi:hypothetical protein
MPGKHNSRSNEGSLQTLALVIYVDEINVCDMQCLLVKEESIISALKLPPLRIPPSLRSRGYVQIQFLLFSPEDPVIVRLLGEDIDISESSPYSERRANVQLPRAVWYFRR